MPVWRNGRRTRLKILREQSRVGSTPTTGTIEKQSEPECSGCFFHTKQKCRGFDKKRHSKFNLNVN